ncbi:hypothetical protein OAN18_04465 [Nitrosopumilus sp.]|nr:hypothetical protein [Nitrosopumilus sp.]
MPHIVLDKSLNLFDFSILFKPTFQKSPLIKIQDMYVDTRGTNALLSTVVIDDSHHEFFIQLMSGKDRTTIRLLPVTDPPSPEAKKILNKFLHKLSTEEQKIFTEIVRIQREIEPMYGY